VMMTAITPTWTVVAPIRVITQSHTYRELPRECRPQDPMMDGSGWTFVTLEHGGEYPDTMPQAIKATDPQGRSCIYVPVSVNGAVVDTVAFELTETAE
jgi:hypothetical protein